MISQETKDQIDDIATDIATLDSGKERRQAINMALLKYAEKLEEKDKDIEHIMQEYQRFEKQLESKDHEIIGLKDELDIANKLWQQIRDAAESNKLRFIEKKEQLESRDRELAQLKEIAKSMADLITEWCPEKVDYKATTKIKVLTAYAEWCKQND